MLKLICPRCMKPVSVPDDFAGREVTCPSCMKPFDAPTKYTPTVIDEPAKTISPALEETISSSIPESKPMAPDVSSQPVAPPGLVPPAPPPVPPTAPSLTVAPPPLPVGYTRSKGFTISPKVILWMPAVLLTITLFCTFFPWVGTYLGGSAVNSQGPWRAIFGAVNRNYVLEEKVSAPNGWLDHVPDDWGLIVPFLICLIFAPLFRLGR